MRQVPRERERERAKDHWWSSTTDEERGAPRDYERRNNLSLIYMERKGSMHRVYFAVCLVLSAPDFIK
jgi:hypothetical protein